MSQFFNRQGHHSLFLRFLIGLLGDERAELVVDPALAVWLPGHPLEDERGGVAGGDVEAERMCVLSELAYQTALQVAVSLVWVGWIHL